MFAAVDAVAIDAQPRRDHAPGWILFFVCFMLFGSLLVLNLFVGVLLENFQRKRNAVNEENSPFGAGSIFATEAQREWVKATERTLRAARAARPAALARAASGADARERASARARAARARAPPATHAYFEGAVLALVLGNVTMMASEHRGQLTGSRARARSASSRSRRSSRPRRRSALRAWAIGRRAAAVPSRSTPWNMFTSRSSSARTRASSCASRRATTRASARSRSRARAASRARCGSRAATRASGGSSTRCS